MRSCCVLYFPNTFVAFLPEPVYCPSWQYVKCLSGDETGWNHRCAILKGHLKVCLPRGFEATWSLSGLPPPDGYISQETMKNPPQTHTLSSQCWDNIQSPSVHRDFPQRPRPFITHPPPSKISETLAREQVEHLDAVQQFSRARRLWSEGPAGFTWLLSRACSRSKHTPDADPVRFDEVRPKTCKDCEICSLFVCLFIQ